MTVMTAERLALAITEEDADRLFFGARTANHFTDEPVSTADQKRWGRRQIIYTEVR